MSAPFLILFDIDGTLLNTGGVGIGALKKGLDLAFPEEFAEGDFPELSLGGATDSGLIDPIFSAFGIESTETNVDRFFDHYAVELEKRLNQSAEEGQPLALAGALELVDYFSKQPNCYAGLLTGNIEKCAYIKLAAIEIDQLSLPIGAFGCDHPDRNKLGPIAIERAETHFQETFVPQQVIVLGDTTKDIDCAKACGAKVAAVATGSHDRDTLLEKSPDFFFEDFSDYENVAKQLLG